MCVAWRVLRRQNKSLQHPRGSTAWFYTLGSAIGKGRKSLDGHMVETKVSGLISVLFWRAGPGAKSGPGPIEMECLELRTQPKPSRPIFKANTAKAPTGKLLTQLGGHFGSIIPFTEVDSCQLLSPLHFCIMFPGSNCQSHESPLYTWVFLDGARASKARCCPLTPSSWIRLG